MVFAVLALVCLGVHSVVSAPYEGPQNVDVDQILQSERLVDNYVDCFLDKKPCSPEGQQIKDKIPEGVKEKCEKCSEKGRVNVKKVFQHMIQKKPALWQELLAKYDPDSLYRTNIDDFLKN